MIGKKRVLMLALVISTSGAYGTEQTRIEKALHLSKKSGIAALCAGGLVLTSITTLSSVAWGASMAHLNYGSYNYHNDEREPKWAQLYLASIPAVFSLAAILTYLNAKGACYCAKKIKETIKN